jgi:hypothetical protein
MIQHIKNLFRLAKNNFTGILIAVGATACGYVIGMCRVELYAIKAGAATYEHNVVIFHRDRSAELLAKLDQAMQDQTITNGAIEAFVAQAQLTVDAIGKVPYALDTEEGVDLLRQYADLQIAIIQIKRTLGMPFRVELLLRSITPTPEPK